MPNEQRAFGPWLGPFAKGQVFHVSAVAHAALGQNAAGPLSALQPEGPPPSCCRTRRTVQLMPRHPAVPSADRPRPWGWRRSGAWRSLKAASAEAVGSVVQKQAAPIVRTSRLQRSAANPVALGLT